MGVRDSTLFFAMARKDFKAMRNMLDADAFDEEIFGFHAQQAIEKALKAWLASRDVMFPRTHDLSLLMNLLAEAGEDIEPFFDLIEYNAFAIQFRYENLAEDEEPLKRAAVVQRVGDLVTKVERMVC